MRTKDEIDGTGYGGRETWAKIAQIALDRATRENRVNWCLTIDLASANVLAETDSDKLYINLEILIELSRTWQHDLRSRSIRKLCIARVPDNGDNMACSEPATKGDFCEKHA